MGRRPKYTFLQRRYTDGQQAQEMMLNIAMHIKTTIKFHTSLVKIALIKILQIVNAGVGVEKRELPYTVGGNINWHNHYR